MLKNKKKLPKVNSVVSFKNVCTNSCEKNSMTIIFHFPNHKIQIFYRKIFFKMIWKVEIQELVIENYV